MMRNKNNFYAIVFTLALLFFSCIIRSGIIVDKSFLPRYLSLSIILLVTCLFFFRKKLCPYPDFFTISLILFYLWNLVSCTWAISFAEALMQSQMVFICLALYLIISASVRENAAFEGIFIKTHLLVLVFSFVLAFNKMSALTFYDPYKIVSISANNNLFSGFLLLSLPLVLAGYSLFKGFWKYLSVSVAVMTLFFIIILQSRAAYLGILFAFLLALLLICIRYFTVFSKRNIIVASISLFILFICLFIFYSSLDNTRRNYFLSKVPVWSYFKGYDNTFAEKLLQKREMMANNAQTGAFDFSENYYENANFRIIFWKKSLGLIKSHPLMGVGAGNWRLAVPSTKDPSNPEHTLKNYTYSQPHNEWISILSELGIAGLILSLFVFFLPLGIVFYRIVFEVQRPHISVLFYASFLVGFYLFSAFDFPLKRVEHNVILFSVFAFLFHKVPLAPLKLDYLLPSRSGFYGSIFSRQWLRRAISLLGSWILVSLLLLSIVISLTRLRGEYFTLKMFGEERKNDLNVIHYCQKAENPFYRITPNTLPVAWFEGVAHYRSGDVNTAANCFDRALRSTPYEVRVLNDYGISLYGLKRTAEAKSVLKRSIAIDPFFDDARFNLGAIYYLTGERDSALFYITSCRNSTKKRDFLNELKPLVPLTK